MPEITVGGFLQNKDMQSKYLSYIKPKSKEEQITSAESIPLEEKQIDSSVSLNKIPIVNTPIHGTQTNNFSNGPTYNYSTVTNYNISNYNFNQNVPANPTPNIPSNLSLYNNNNNLQMISKISKPPVLNNTFLNPQPPTLANKPIPATLQELHYQKNVSLSNMNNTGRFISNNSGIV